ncbi:mediator of RNA polymerase II transcription subunit 20-like protein [Sarcoptes scabiei]|uniref:Mediator of RNA polymerase II transcription subunit 20 n=1 Tax=Sarcoptes scabiei TaxID=52283 RepID=A0A131ZZA0_SARSC|nr:mediator of RNA polymerase II transcription subunit 20-like protein [Sarcoptes scabiei]
MVVSSVHIISDVSSGPQMIETYQANLEALRAKKSGTFLIECDTYYSNPARMEVRGQKWILNDFVIKLGSCTLGANFRAIMLEIEYGPCSIPANCWDLIKELGRTFVGPIISKPHQHLLSKMNEIYCPVDTIHQYNDLFNQIKKQAPQVVKN